MRPPTDGDDGAQGDEDDLTSLTARARKLEFAGYVYVDEGTSDAEILRAVQQQTQSAFGALRTANVGVNSRELKDVDPTTFVKTPVTVVDPANPRAPARKMTKVAYTYTDNALVPIPMATRSAISLALLGKNYASQIDADPPASAPTNDKEAQGVPSSIWYVFNPSLAHVQGGDGGRAAEDRRRPPAASPPARSRSAR